MDYHALDLLIEPAAREAVEYSLMEAGALGTESVDRNDGFTNITAYFSSLPEREVVRNHLADALRIYQMATSSVRDISVRLVPERDWLAEWKRSWRPVEVGSFIIAPTWIDVPENRDRQIITIEPGMAFGTGTHETTRLCLAAIEKYFVGDSFLDVGTGTGVLAIAAAKLNPTARVEACDTDADAITIAKENAQVNKVLERINFKVGSIDDATASADLVCANLTADVIIEILPLLLNVTCGRLVLSGILIEQVEKVRNRLFECGVSNEVEALQEGEWATLIV
jgi:ribosomal protein L11 methyltransferase